ncbi:hypothetical protein PFISCL1PPCAC_19871 [Pristionchus fissidentatus]|uniref:Myotubularin phosphatase domain-containing protein n=1 Tax=Pristionchus fissidentatus TaxID=1538716 RepID=A0AAV5WCV8_9BILA|nr:hypothetical protein PFISCL1PPCAC_19871 [Pristionchus fissidentatus]
MECKQSSWLLRGESIQYTEKSMCLLVLNGRMDGQMIITNYRLIFESRNCDDIDESKPIFDIAVGLVLKIQKIGKQSGLGRARDIYGIMICTKDNNCIKLSCSDVVNRRKNLVDALNIVCFPVDRAKKMFAFCNNNEGRREDAVDGWTIYEPQKEFRRLEIPSSSWDLTTINANYQLTSTYPRILVIPTAAIQCGKEFMKRVANFRSKERLAVLSWIDSTTEAVIVRSSQPLTGMTMKKSTDDELYMKMIVDANTNGHRVVIYDARPSVNAQVNRAKGGGYEIEYDRCALKFLNIQNIHVVRDSLKKLQDSLFPRVNNKNYVRQVDESRWLHHIQSILEGVWCIVNTVHNEKCSTLVHCSDGWDRTSQLTSLSMLCLDPYYRTIEGFAVLIEKEWCSFGHKFSQRCSQGIDGSTDNERSPIFIQFLDCVFQIMSQFPVFFEFNESLLIEIAHHLYSTRFGTFLFNSEKERMIDNSCGTETASLWTEIMERKKEWINPLYVKGFVLFLNSSHRVLQVWISYYGRHNDEIINTLSNKMSRYGLNRALGAKALLQQIVTKYEQSSSRV